MSREECSANYRCQANHPYHTIDCPKIRFTAGKPARSKP